MLEKFRDNLSNNKEIYFRVKVIPGAIKTELKGEMADETLKIALAAAPEKGEANKELINYLNSFGKDFKELYKHALKSKENDISIEVNGILSDSTNSAALPSILACLVKNNSIYTSQTGLSVLHATKAELILQ